MTYGNFNNRVTVTVPDNDADVILLGSTKYEKNFNLKHVVVWCFLKGVSNVTNEQIQLKIHSSSNTSRVLTSSNLIRLSDCVSGTTNYKFRVRFDFDDFQLSSNNTYYLSFNTTNYTRNGNTFYLAVERDNPFSTNPLGSAETASTINDIAYRYETFGEF